MVSAFEQFLEGSWIFIFLVSIVFIFLLIYRDLGKYTRVLKTWRRASYQKVVPKIMLAFQHFTRRGELISLNNRNLYTKVRQEMINYLQFKKGLTNEEVKTLVGNKKQLQNLIPDEKVIAFLTNYAEWYALISPQISVLDRIFRAFCNLFSRQQKEANQFYLEIAFVIRSFRKALEH
ncbi:MAG: hypothetical protein DRP02_03840 [Candidatus Gerdarchaeota archaeon]|nr:MAG: hypothetical protein DRO63_00780 [Candidatus Gerdarchaeota archaeon]RLI71762.1 MAG: hypothetical protein DRP02_03840 [Candidatus Gerdarchaeota archaeon]